MLILLCSADNLYYQLFDAGKVCLGGNDASGVGSNYLVLVGPVTDLTMHPSHRVEINNLRTHSCPNGATTPGERTRPCFRLRRAVFGLSVFEAVMIMAG